MSSSEEAQCVLILDLSSDNPISERSVEPFLPPCAMRSCAWTSWWPLPGRATRRRDRRVTPDGGIDLRVAGRTPIHG